MTSLSSAAASAAATESMRWARACSKGYTTIYEGIHYNIRRDTPQHTKGYTTIYEGIHYNVQITCLSRAAASEAATESVRWVRACSITFLAFSFNFATTLRVIRIQLRNLNLRSLHPDLVRLTFLCRCPPASWMSLRTTT